MNKALFKSEMVKNDITRAELAKELGIDYSSLTQKINGKRQFTVGEAMKICEVLHIEDPKPIFFTEDVPNMQQEEV